MQHGCGYFTSKNTSIQTDLDTSDKFLSWGNFKKQGIIPFIIQIIYVIKKKMILKKSKIFFYAQLCTLVKESVLITTTCL